MNRTDMSEKLDTKSIFEMCAFSEPGRYAFQNLTHGISYG